METVHEMSKYSQVTTGQRLGCGWCDQDYNSITEHWFCHCRAMGYWQELITARLNEHDLTWTTEKPQLQ